MSAGTLIFLLLIGGALFAMFAMHRGGAGGTGTGCGGHGGGSPQGRQHEPRTHGVDPSEGATGGRSATAEQDRTGRRGGCC